MCRVRTIAEIIESVGSEKIQAYQRAQQRLYDGCESPAERSFLHGLLKHYDACDIQQQVSIGRYRVDFVAENIAWEIDGKQWHDIEKDKIRDLEILKSGKLSAIVRTPAAAYHFFRDACLNAYALWFKSWPEHLRNQACVYDFDMCKREATAAHKHWENTLELDAVHYFVQGEAVAGDGSDSRILIGSPYAMLQDEHPIDKLVPFNEQALHKNLFTLERRTLKNAEEWCV